MTESRTRRRPKGLFLGLATVDITYPVAEIPGRNAKISVASQHLAAGGPATNAAITFACLGGRSSLVTAVGAHSLGSVIRRDLEASGVALHDLARRRNVAPPVSSIMVLQSTGERTVVSANAAAFSPLPARFNPRWLQGVSIVQVDGHYMPLCIAGARSARSRGIPVVLESGSWKDGMEQLLPFVDIAVCSADYHPPGCRDQDDVMEFLAKQGIRRMAITRGASAIRFVEQGERGRIAVEKIRPIDTLGAGDVFHGAFCYYASQPGRNFRQALAAAATVATFSCRYQGTRSWIKAFADAQKPAV
ncbi:MAG: PfkB family carbohydrate kinase [Candidatus Korobacteraceae bacterium]